MGYNWQHSYNMGIKTLDDNAFLFLHSDGRESYLPVLQPGESYFDRKEQLAWSLDNHDYLLMEASGLQYRFSGPENRFGYRMLSSIHTQDGFSVRMKYALPLRRSGQCTPGRAI